MIIRCQSCQTEFALDDAHIRPEGTAVQCSVCSEVFTVAAPDPRDLGRRPWQIRTRSGQLFCANTLAQVRNWILEGRLHQNDQLSRTGQRWLRLGWVPEFAPSFGGSAVMRRGPMIEVLPARKAAAYVARKLGRGAKPADETKDPSGSEPSPVRPNLQGLARFDEPGENAKAPEANPEAPELSPEAPELSPEAKDSALASALALALAKNIPAPQESAEPDHVTSAEPEALEPAPVKQIEPETVEPTPVEQIEAEALKPAAAAPPEPALDSSEPELSGLSELSELSEPSSPSDSQPEPQPLSSRAAGELGAELPAAYMQPDFIGALRLWDHDAADSQTPAGDSEQSSDGGVDRGAAPAAAECRDRYGRARIDAMAPASGASIADVLDDADAQVSAAEPNEAPPGQLEPVRGEAERVEAQEPEPEPEEINIEELAEADVEEIAAELDLSEDGPALEDLARANKIGTAERFLAPKAADFANKDASDAVTSVYEAIQAGADSPKEGYEEQKSDATPALSLKAQVEEERKRDEAAKAAKVSSPAANDTPGTADTPSKMPSLWPQGASSPNGPSRAATFGVAIAAMAAVGIGSWYLQSSESSGETAGAQVRDASALPTRAAISRDTLYRAQEAVQSMNPKAMLRAESDLQRALETSPVGHPTTLAARRLLCDVLVRRSLQYTLASNVGGENSDTLQSAAQSDLRRARELFDKLAADPRNKDDLADLKLRLSFAEGRPLRELPALLPPTGARDLRALIRAAPLWRDPQNAIPVEKLAELEGVSQELLVGEKPDPLLQAAVALAHLQVRRLDAVTAWSTVRLAAAPLDPVAREMEGKVLELRAAGEDSGAIPGSTAADSVLAASAARAKKKAGGAEVIAADIAARDQEIRAEENLDAMVSRGCRLVERGSATQGIEVLQAALDLAPGNIDVQICLAEGYARKGRQVQALGLFEQVLQRSPEHRSALYGAATSSATQGKHDKAVEFYRRLIKVEPNHGPARAYLEIHDAS